MSDLGVEWWSVGISGDSESTVSQPAHEEGPQLNLLGSHRHALDGKRRVAIPKLFREAVHSSLGNEGYVLCRQLGGDNCLALYPQASFDAALNKLEAMRSEALGIGSKVIRSYLRRIRMSATPVAPDKQGRITLGEEQCQLAGIEREVVFVGCGDHAEVWAPSELEPSDGEDFHLLAQQLFG